MLNRIIDFVLRVAALAAVALIIGAAEGIADLIF